MMNRSTIFSSCSSIVYEDNAEEIQLVEQKREAIYRDFLYKQNRGISFVIMQHILNGAG